MPTIPCFICGKPVTRVPSQLFDHVYCSRECYHKHPRSSSEHTCEHCGKPYTAYNSRIKRGERFCSRDCYEANRAAEYIIKSCHVCGKEFTIKRIYDERYTVCSRACRIAETKYIACKRCGAVFRAEKHLNRHYCSEECRRPPTHIDCANCGKRLRIVPSNVERRFCSRSCYRKFVGETSIEIAVRHALDELAIPYEQEVQFASYTVDFLVRALGVALEVDGTYWHRNPNRDKRKNAYLAAHGWKVCRITEAEIDDAGDLPALIRERLNALTVEGSDA